MDDLKKIRSNIAAIDEQMADLFQKRMKESKKVAYYKKEKGLPVLDLKREAELIQKNIDLITDEETKDYYVEFFKSILKVSKDYQNKIIDGVKVAYCGEKGAYAYLAAREVCQTPNLVPCSSFSSAYKKVENGEVDLCVLPIENSYAGDVGEVMDLIFNGSLYINRIIELDINHALLVNKGVKLEDVKTVMSHPQALAQCDEYISSKGFQRREYINTALACKELKEKGYKDVGVIANRANGEIYSLDVLADNINTSRNNTTRFGLFSRSPRQVDPSSKMGENFIIVFTVSNSSGSLAKVLDIIGVHNFNMRNLRSRPSKELIWNYYFFIEIEGNINSDEGRQMIGELSSFCDKFKVVGSYSLLK